MIASATLLDLIDFRNRMSMELAFLENDVVMQALLIAKTKRGVMGRLRVAVKVETASTSTIPVGLRLGPRGGLPRTKPELVELATSLHIDATGTVA